MQASSTYNAPRLFEPARYPDDATLRAALDKGGASCARCGRLFASPLAYDAHREAVKFGDCNAVADETLLSTGWRLGKGVWRNANGHRRR